MHPANIQNIGGKNNGTEKRKIKKQNRFFLCFGAMDMDMDMDSSVVQPVGRRERVASVGENPVIEVVKVDHKDGVIVPVLPVPEEEFIVSKEDKSRKSFMRIVKAVLFETSPAKKMKKKGRDQKSFQSTVNQSAKVDQKDSNPRTKYSAASSSSLWSSGSGSCFSSSRSSATTCSSFRSDLTESKQKQNDMQEDGKGYYGSNTGLCVLLVSLLVLVFWGKCCSILCTSVWLFFAPRLSIRKRLLQEVDGYRGFDSFEYKKKIIMAGLLERNRDRGGRA